jgi:hypothetical protein
VPLSFANFFKLSAANALAYFAILNNEKVSNMLTSPPVRSVGPDLQGQLNNRKERKWKMF